MELTPASAGRPRTKSTSVSTNSGRCTYISGVKLHGKMAWITTSATVGSVVASVRHFRALFADGGCYVAAIPTYVGGHMAMGWASDDTDLRNVAVATLAQRYDAAGRFPTRYWTPEVHRAAFALPRFIAQHVAGAAG